MKEEIQPSTLSRQIVKTGRDLDAEVARLLGWANVEPDCYTPIGKELCGDDPEGTGGFNRTGRKIVPRYSERIEAAMQVVERLINAPFRYRVLTDQGGDHKSVLVEIKRISGDAWIYIARVEAETLPLAICRAALSAVDSQ